jgi:hypothetical protein
LTVCIQDEALRETEGEASKLRPSSIVQKIAENEPRSSPEFVPEHVIERERNNILVFDKL